MSDRSFAAACARNTAPILGVLRHEFRDAATVLEIGSGNGQHAAAFATALPQLTWQTSDLDENLDGIRAWVAHAALPNMPAPLCLDVLNAEPGAKRYDGVFSANTAHIMSFTAVCAMFAVVASVLPRGGQFCLYGPFRVRGEFNAPSNEAFDRSLRDSDPQMGIRDLEDLDAQASAGGLERRRLYAMPANNYLAVWAKCR